MSNKKTTKTKQTQTSTPPSWITPGLSTLGGLVEGNLQSRPPLYEGNFVAGPNEYDQLVAGSYADSAARAAALADQMTALTGGSMAGPTYGGPAVAQPGTFANWDVAALQPVINASINPALRALTEQVLPSLQSSMIDSGAYNSDRAMTVLPAMAMQDFNQEAQRVAAQIAYQDFSDYENRMLQAFGLNTERGLGDANVLTQRLALQPELMTTAMRLATGSGDLMAAAGGYDRSLEQMQIDDALARWNYEATAPYAGLDIASSILAQIGNPWGTQDLTGKTTQKSSGLGNVLSGALGLGMTAAGMGLNPFGTAAGAATAGIPLLTSQQNKYNPFTASIWGGA